MKASGSAAYRDAVKSTMSSDAFASLSNGLSLEAFMTDRFATVPSNHFLGLRLLGRSDTEATIEVDARPEFAQEYGVVHGGLLAWLADTAAVYVTLPSLEGDQRMTSVEFKVNFLAAARPEGGVLRAHAQLVKRGRRIVLCEVSVGQGEREVLRGLFTYAMI